jgi:hypothetical protein
VSEPSDPTEVVVEPPPPDPDRLAEEVLHRLNLAEANLQVPETLPTPVEPDITDLVPTSGNYPAATAEQAAGGRTVDVYKAALEHYQKTLEAAEKLLPIVAPGLGAAGALGGAAGSGGIPGQDLLRSSSGGQKGLPGRNISETGGPLNIASGNGNQRGRTSRDRAGTGDGPIERLATEIVRDIGIPSLKAALAEDRSLAALPPEQLSEPVSKAIIDGLLDSSRTANPS